MLNLLSIMFSIVAFATEPSLYEIQGIWSRQDGRSLPFKEFMGQPVLVSMVYTGCAHTCPLTVKKLQSIAQAAESRGLGAFRIVLASFDTEGDRPKQLAEYMKKQKLDSKRWTLLSATDDSVVRELAVVLGVSYKRLAKTDFSHSNVIVLLDSSGVIRYRLEGLTSDAEPLLKTWSELGKNPPSGGVQ